MSNTLRTFFMIYSGEKIGALLAFSLYTNTKKLLSCAIPKSPDAIRCLDGIRAITAAWILFGHVVSFFLLSPTRNKDYIETVRTICHAETMSNFSNLYMSFQYYSHVISMTVLSMPIAVDTFLATSGLLVTISLLKHFEKTYVVRWTFYKCTK